MTTYAIQVTDKTTPGDTGQAIVGTPEWAEQNLGGDWVQMPDPYDPDPDDPRVYAGPGMKYDPGVIEQFTGDIWTNEKATVPDLETGEYFYNTEGMLTWHEPTGKIWRNLSPTGTPNVWEPGVANWREYPLDGGVPVWVQPVGSVDAYPLGFEVKHDGKLWRSNVPANVWEPGAQGITQWNEVDENGDIVVPEVGGEWAAGVSYSVDDEVAYGGVTYRCLQAHTAIVGWEPPNVPSLWQSV